MNCNIAIAAISLSLLALAGCRREDVREVTIDIPGLTEANRAQVVEALSKYQGVLRDSFQWDMAAKKLTLKYDSMKVAQSNLRYAIDEKGIKVAFPAKTDDHAGH